jgi:hypothetical protein
MHRPTIHAGLILVCLSGCAHVKAPASTPVPAATVSSPAQTAVPAPEVQPPPKSAAATPPAASAEAPVAPAKIAAPGPASVKAKPPSAKGSPKPPATVASATPPSKPAAAAAAPVAATPAAAAPVAVDKAPEQQATLDLGSLEQRLRDTHAIGVLTKLSLKNQVDDLLNQFRSFYRGEGKTSLPELRQRYNLLLLKVLSLLQDGDAQLAAMISSSREAIWGILADPEKFSKI